MRHSLDLLTIPDEHLGRVPCQVTPLLFTDRMLDVDLDDPEFLDLTHAQQRARLQMKQAAEARAVTACTTCPIMNDCREWAIRAHVFGVAGAMTQAERSRACGNVVPEYAALTERGPRGKVREDVIMRWADQGMPAKQIARYLQASTRTVERYLANPRTTPPVDSDSTPIALIELPAEATFADVEDEHGLVLTASNMAAAARTPINFERVSPETLAMYQALSDGAVRSREEIINVAAQFVDDAAALNAGKNLTGTRDRKIEAGRRKFLLNRIDIAVRRGRMHTAKANGTVIVWLDNATRDEYVTWAAGMPALTRAC
jgi:hypothetical protein